MSEEKKVEAKPITCVPAKPIKRNEFGLICEDVNYIYDESGFIDWRKMISTKYLVPNRQMFEKNGKKVPTSIETLDDKELLILLAGIKDLAQVRGFTNVKYQVESSSPEHVIAVCSITWIPNYETEGREVVFSGIGDASVANTSSFAKMYLAPIAENRAFVRAVRNFLRIHIVGQDEVNLPIPGGASNPNTKMVTSVLLEVMNQNSISFDIVKNKLVREKYVDDNGKSAESYTSTDDIPVDKQYELIAAIKAKAAKKSE